MRGNETLSLMTLSHLNTEIENLGKRINSEDRIFFRLFFLKRLEQLNEKRDQINKVMLDLLVSNTRLGDFDSICKLVEILETGKLSEYPDFLVQINLERKQHFCEVILVGALKLAEKYIKKDLILEIATSTKKNDSSLSSLREELKWLVHLFVALEEAVEDERKNQISKKLAELRGIKLPSEQRTVMAKNPHVLLPIKRGGYHQNETNVSENNQDEFVEKLR